MNNLVLDTNTVLALWFFVDPGLTHLRSAIQARNYTLFSRDDALDELRCVLTYPQFELTATRQSTIFEAYAGACTLIAAPRSGAMPLPICRDRDDQKFLEITRDARANYLITRDKALLKLNRHRLVRPLFVIMTPDAFATST